ncbi:MAG: RNA 2',3'-cyclic phosphodiesterase [Candidatus Xenobiia bacterium LiM19]
MDVLRLFYAMFISSRIGDTLTRHISQCALSGADVKWVESQNLHLTLKFLGEVQQERLEEILAAGESAADGVKDFRVFWEGFGAFPDFRRPRVIWAGMKQGGRAVSEIVERLEDRLAAAGFRKEERAFRPHLTIGRVKSQRGMEELRKVVEKIENSRIGEMEVGSFSLVQSTLTSKGPIYREVRNFALGAKDDG